MIVQNLSKFHFFSFILLEQMNLEFNVEKKKRRESVKSFEILK